MRLKVESAFRFACPDEQDRLKRLFGDSVEVTKENIYKWMRDIYNDLRGKELRRFRIIHGHLYIWVIRATTRNLAHAHSVKERVYQKMLEKTATSLYDDYGGNAEHYKRAIGYYIAEILHLAEQHDRRYRRKRIKQLNAWIEKNQAKINAHARKSTRALIGRDSV